MLSSSQRPHLKLEEIAAVIDVDDAALAGGVLPELVRLALPGWACPRTETRIA